MSGNYMDGVKVDNREVNPNFTQIFQTGSSFWDPNTFKVS